MKVFAIKKGMAENAEYQHTIGMVLCIDIFLKNISFVMTKKMLCKAAQCPSWVYSHTGLYPVPHWIFKEKLFQTQFEVTVVCWWHEAKLLILISTVQETCLFFISHVALLLFTA